MADVELRIDNTADPYLALGVDKGRAAPPSVVMKNVRSQDQQIGR